MSDTRRSDQAVSADDATPTNVDGENTGVDSINTTNSVNQSISDTPAHTNNVASDTSSKAGTGTTVTTNRPVQDNPENTEHPVDDSTVPPPSTKSEPSETANKVNSEQVDTQHSVETLVGEVGTSSSPTTIGKSQNRSDNEVQVLGNQSIEVKRDENQNSSPETSAKVGSGETLMADDKRSSSTRDEVDAKVGTSEDSLFSALRTRIKLTQEQRRADFEVHRQFHNHYVGSDHNYRRARIVVQRAIKEVYRIRKREATRILKERELERQRAERAAQEEAYRNREMRVVKTRERHMSAIRRRKRPHLALWPPQVRHPAYYKRRNLRDLATRWNHPQAHPASFHLKSATREQIVSAMASADEAGTALELPPTKSRVSTVSRDNLLNAEVFHPASVSVPDTVSTIRRRTHDPKQVSPVFFDYKLHVVVPGVPAKPPRGTILSSSQIAWAWAPPNVDGGDRISETQVWVSPWNDAQQPIPFEGLITTYTTPSHFSNEEADESRSTADQRRGGTKTAAAIRAGRTVVRPVVPGVSYRLRVRFRNRAGWGPWSKEYDPAGSPAVNTRVVFHSLVTCNTEYEKVLSNSKPKPSVAPPVFTLPLALRNDASAVQQALVHSFFGNIPKSQSQLLLDLPKETYRRNLVDFCRRASLSHVASRSTVFLYIVAQSCHVQDSAPMSRRKKSLVSGLTSLSKFSTYFLCSDSVLTGKRADFEAHCLSETELVETLREYLHVEKCCIIFDVCHNHGIWRDTDGRRKLKVGPAIGAAVVNRNVHHEFMTSLELLLSKAQQQSAWKTLIKNARARVRKEDQEAKKHKRAGAPNIVAASDKEPESPERRRAQRLKQLTELKVALAMSTRDLFAQKRAVSPSSSRASLARLSHLHPIASNEDVPVGPVVKHVDGQTGAVTLVQEDGGPHGMTAGGILLTHKDGTQYRVAVDSLAEAAYVVVRHLEDANVTPLLTEYSAILSAMPPGLHRRETNVQRLADVDEWRAVYTRQVAKRAKDEIRDQEKHQRAVVVAKRKRKPIPPPPKQRPPVWHHFPPPPGSIVLFKGKPRVEEEPDHSDEESQQSDGADEGASQKGSDEAHAEETDPDKLAELARRAEQEAASQAQARAAEEEERRNPRPFVAWGFDYDELYMGGANGATVSVSEQELLDREEESRSRAEGDANGRNSRFQLKDDSDDDADDRVSDGSDTEREDFAMTAFAATFLRCLRPQRPVLADPLLHAIFSRNPGGIDFARISQYFERALPSVSNEWTDAFVTVRPVSFGMHEWVRVKVHERVNTSKPTAYLVRFPATLRCGQSLQSAQVLPQPIPKGKRLLVDRVEGRRARVVFPVRGWVSTHSKEGVKLLIRAPEEASDDDAAGRAASEVRWRVEVLREHAPRHSGLHRAASSFVTELFQRSTDTSTGTGEFHVVETKDLRPGPLLAGLLKSLKKRREKKRPKTDTTPGKEEIDQSSVDPNNPIIRRHQEKKEQEALADEYLSEKFDVVSVDEAKNEIVALEEQEHSQLIESEIPAWLRVGAITEARLLLSTHSICCAPVRIPQPGVPFMARCTATSITLTWDVTSLSNVHDCPPIEYFQLQIRNISVARGASDWTTLPLAHDIQKLRSDAQQKRIVATRNASDAALDYFDAAGDVRPENMLEDRLPPNKYCVRRLLRGEAYQFRVRACSAAGCGPYSRASVSMGVETDPVPTLASDLYFASATPSLDIFAKSVAVVPYNTNNRRRADRTKSAKVSTDLVTQVDLLQLLLDQSIGGGHVDALVAILHRMCAVLSNDCVAPVTDRRHSLAVKGRKSVCHRLLVTRAEPASRFEKQILWLRARLDGPKLITDAKLNATAKPAKLPSQRIPKQKIDFVTAILKTMHEFPHHNELMEVACRCIGLVATIAATSRAPPPRKFGEVYRGSNRGKDKDSISAARVLLLTPIRTGSKASLTNVLASQSAAQGRGVRQHGGRRRLAFTLRSEAEAVIREVVLATNGENVVSPGTVATARWALGRLKVLDELEYKAPKPRKPPKPTSGAVHGRKMSTKAVYFEADKTTVTPGDIAQHQRLSSARGQQMDPFQLPMPGQITISSGESDTSSTGDEDDDDVDPMGWSSSDDDLDDETMRMHMLMEDQAYNAKAVCDSRFTHVSTSVFLPIVRVTSGRRRT